MANQNHGGSGNFADDSEHASEAGRKGGQHAQGGAQKADVKNVEGSGPMKKETTGATHRGGSGNFAENRQRASEAGRKGGLHSHSGRQ